MTRVKNAIKQMKLRDFFAPFIFLILLIPSITFRLINKIKKRKLWLIAEDGQARDNGYHFYRYIRLNHPDDYCFYAIDYASSGFEKVNKLGNTVRYGGARHWLFYMAADLNISSQKGGNPCPIFWYFMHVVLGQFKNRIFLQHGVISNQLDWLYYKKCKFKYFITSTKNEYEYIKKYYGYPQESVILTGLSRWDNLINSQDGNAILVMPTWRKDLGLQDNHFDKERFLRSDYYNAWNGLLNDDLFIEFVEKNNILVYFYPHQRMQSALGLFNTKSKNIKIVSLDEDIQEFFSKCSIMITDYSSAVFDFAYLKKPIIYYQFDKEYFHEKQYKSGTFSYERDGFGKIVITRGELIDEIKRIYKNGIDNLYLKRIENTFIFYDDRNSERIYNAIKNNGRAS